MWTTFEQLGLFDLSILAKGKMPVRMFWSPGGAAQTFESTLKVLVAGLVTVSAVVLRLKRHSSNKG